MLQQQRAGNLHAFTLIELMTVIAIVAFVAVIAIPGIQGFLANTDTNVYATSLANSLRVAKQRAVYEHKYVTVCPVNNMVVASTADINIPACITSGTWNAWVAFIDHNIAANNLSSSVLISLTSNIKANSISSPQTGSLIFDPDGFVTVDSLSASSRREFYVSAPGCRGKNAKRVSVLRSSIILTYDTECISL